MTRPGNRARVLFAAPLLVVALLGGCASPDAGLEADTGRELQQGVVLVADAAAAGDITGAIAALDALEARLAEAEADGSVSASRLTDIRAAIAAVRADLSPVVETPTPTPQPSSVEPAEPVAPVDDGADEPGDDDDKGNGDGNDGDKGDNGKNGDKGNNGKGNGNGKKDK
ncbi:hypothetical protein ITJ57_16930 [Plantibacter sp. VKM Ac-2880]|uniref:hypothetical protein n=1 Tax=Plantibacter sp. VKM Ac-2880 TaxID=2783827 RepID=UPI0018903BF0|nr:hypothetical protein [Plantibacter sp. VKM Ac-2880]MBF4570453.1 hypothetical protein [Plantibacter sp. VKM Ac-2880]